MSCRSGRMIEMSSLGLGDTYVCVAIESFSVIK